MNLGNGAGECPPAQPNPIRDGLSDYRRQYLLKHIAPDSALALLVQLLNARSATLISAAASHSVIAVHGDSWLPAGSALPKPLQPLLTSTSKTCTEFNNNVQSLAAEHSFSTILTTPCTYDQDIVAYLLVTIGHPTSPQFQVLLDHVAEIIMKDCRTLENELRTALCTRMECSLAKFVRDCAAYMDSGEQRQQHPSSLSENDSSHRAYGAAIEVNIFKTACKIQQEAVGCTGVYLLVFNNDATEPGEIMAHLFCHTKYAAGSMPSQWIGKNKITLPVTIISNRLGTQGSLQYKDHLPSPLQSLLPLDATVATIDQRFDRTLAPFALSITFGKKSEFLFPDLYLQYSKDFGEIVFSEIAKCRLRDADDHKNVFMSNISHELRSPLHGLLASSELMLDTSLNALQRSFLDTIESCGRTLLDVINNVLDFAKLGSLMHHEGRGRLSSFSGPECLRDENILLLTEQSIRTLFASHEFQPLHQTDIGSRSENFYSEDGGVDALVRDPLVLIIDARPSDIGWSFHVTAGAFRRIFMNTVGNAVKYTKKGYVHVQMEILAAREGQALNLLQLVVTDSGKGILPEFLQNGLFQPFQQEDPFAEGTGLGMNIVKQLVHSLQGEIAVTSEVGKGTQVCVTIPMEDPEEDSNNQIRDFLNVFKNRVQDIKVCLINFNLEDPARKLLHQSISDVLTDWFGCEIKQRIADSDFIISDEDSGLLEIIQHDDIQENMCPLLFLCTTMQKYEGFDAVRKQAKRGRVLDFLNKPVGPLRLAKAMALCLEKDADRVKHGKEPLIKPDATTPPALEIVEEGSPFPKRTPLEGGTGSETSSAAASDSGNSKSRSPPPRRPSLFQDPYSLGGMSSGTRSPQSPLESVDFRCEKVTSWDSLSPQDDRGRSHQKHGEGDVLTESVAALASPSSESKESSLSGEELETSGTCLVVEDNDINAKVTLPGIELANDQILETYLRKLKFATERALNGKIAVDIVQNRRASFEVILMDIQMPVMNGIDATMRIRELEESMNRKSSIIALTGLSGPEMEKSAMDAGVDKFLTKPVGLSTLKEHLIELAILPN